MSQFVRVVTHFVLMSQMTHMGFCVLDGVNFHVCRPPYLSTGFRNMVIILTVGVTA